MDTITHPVVDAWFTAMRKGKRGEAELLGLFHESAHYTEPFGGSTRRHVGLDAIRTCFREGWEQPVPDLTLTVDRVDIDGTMVRAEWTCNSSAFPGPVRGVDRYTLRDGLIASLETSFL